MEIDSIKAQITEGMRHLALSADAVFLRTVSATGADTLLGLKGTETVTDTEVLLRPMVTNVSERKVAFSNGRLLFGDRSVVFPPGVTEAQLKAVTAVLLGTIQYRVVETEVLDVGGQEVQVQAVVRLLVKP